ncbi:MAG: RagB/SusD family nutrient uptake outer membrane protein [Ferruginibacter sp.]|nr:RagB/SusD family nutrient uptake outer membrane protein [Ferruginibacter sp.]
MKKNLIRIPGMAMLFAVLLASCTDKLNLYPTNDVTSEIVYATPAGYKQSLAKIYGSMALTGNSGPAGQPDVFFPGSDEGANADFFRSFWKAQELSTDEAVISWGDAGIQDFHNMNWTSSNQFLTGVYYKSLYQITLVNEFLRQSQDDKLGTRNITGADADAIRKYRSEVRFLRAYQYWVLMDLFGNPPFVTEENVIGGANPQQISRTDLFAYVESELKAIEGELLAPKTNEYGRADQGAAWALLARVYLNAEVYTGTPKYTEAITYSKKVIDAGYALTADYRQLMLADNQMSKDEFIFTINYDGAKTQGYGGTTFLTHASVGGSLSATSAGVNSGWSGLRTTKALVQKFSDPSGATDKRAQFYTSGQNLEIASQTTFTEGYAITKFRNIKRNGSPGSNDVFVDIDMPVFRLPEMYFIYAEAVKRGGTGGDATTALTYLNAIRTRAYGNGNGNINSVDFTLQYILDERARELYWEGFRRTDLIRYKQFTEGSYLWPWKGGVPGGTTKSADLNLFPLPSSDLNANTNLVQNPGY